MLSLRIMSPVPSAQPLNPAPLGLGGGGAHHDPLVLGPSASHLKHCTAQGVQCLRGEVWLRWSTRAVHEVWSTALHAVHHAIHALHVHHACTRENVEFLIFIFRILSREGGDLHDQILSVISWKNKRKCWKMVLFSWKTWKMVKYFISILSYFGMKMSYFLSKMGYFELFSGIFSQFSSKMGYFLMILS